MDRLLGSIVKPQFLTKKTNEQTNKQTKKQLISQSKEDNIWRMTSGFTSNLHISEHTHTHNAHTFTTTHTHSYSRYIKYVQLYYTHTYTRFCYTYLYNIPTIKKWWFDEMVCFDISDCYWTGKRSIPSLLFPDILVYIFIVWSLRNFRIGPVYWRIYIRF